ncbi:MAG: hypothetical protein Q7S45_05210 [Candidatus Curtissbacteria bacterium]|nr:hypothetical protein [Candidatus Curtissbacteria bacterium]
MAFFWGRMRVYFRKNSVVRLIVTPFRAVPLTAGEHIVRFYFDSDSFKLGAIISVISLVILIAFTFSKKLLTD